MSSGYYIEDDVYRVDGFLLRINPASPSGGYYIQCAMPVVEGDDHHLGATVWVPFLTAPAIASGLKELSEKIDAHLETIATEETINAVTLEKQRIAGRKRGCSKADRGWIPR